MDLEKLQDDLHLWRVKNFPQADSDQQFMGVVEEVGELAHAMLKQKQAIRGKWHLHEAEAVDAVGDILIYLMGLCSYRGWSMERVLTDTAAQVMERDWIASPDDGHVENPVSGEVP